MIPYHPHKPDGPTPEELAAFVDGELDQEASRDVADWLASHPEAAAEVRSLEHFARLWRRTPPPEPSAEQWAEVFGRVAQTLPVRAEARPSRPRWLRWLGPAAAVAAAVVVVVLLRPRPEAPRIGAPPRLEQPFAVATDDDIRIISMDDTDHSALVVGQTPLREPLALVEPDEVTVEQVEPNADGVQPRYATEGTPMIITPLRDEAAKQR